MSCLNSSYISTLLKVEVSGSCIIVLLEYCWCLSSLFQVLSCVSSLWVRIAWVHPSIQVSKACFSYLPWRYRISPSFESDSAVEDGVLQLREAENSLLPASGKESHPYFSKHTSALCASVCSGYVRVQYGCGRTNLQYGCTYLQYGRSTDTGVQTCCYGQYSRAYIWS